MICQNYCLFIVITIVIKLISWPLVGEKKIKKNKDFPDTKTRTFSHCKWQFPQDIWPEMKNMNLEKLICITGVSLWFVSEGEQIVTWSQHQLLRSTLSL